MAGAGLIRVHAGGYEAAPRGRSPKGAHTFLEGAVRRSVGRSADHRLYAETRHSHIDHLQCLRYEWRLVRAHASPSMPRQSVMKNGSTIDIYGDMQRILNMCNFTPEFVTSEAGKQRRVRMQTLSTGQACSLYTSTARSALMQPRVKPQTPSPSHFAPQRHQTIGPITARPYDLQTFYSKLYEETLDFLPLGTPPAPHVKYLHYSEQNLAELLVRRGVTPVAHSNLGSSNQLVVRLPQGCFGRRKTVFSLG